MAAIWNFQFLPKVEKHKFASISLTVRDRAISSKVSTHRVSKKCTIGNFQKIFLPKNGGHFEFSNFCQKWKKHKFAIISFTLQDKAFRRNFRPTGYLSNVVLPVFKKILLSPKMAAILNFHIFAKNGKTEISFYLLNHAG